MSDEFSVWMNLKNGPRYLQREFARVWCPSGNAQGVTEVFTELDDPANSALRTNEYLIQLLSDPDKIMQVDPVVQPFLLNLLPDKKLARKRKNPSSKNDPRPSKRQRPNSCVSTMNENSSETKQETAESLLITPRTVDDSFDQLTINGEIALPSIVPDPALPPLFGLDDETGENVLGHIQLEPLPPPLSLVCGDKVFENHHVNADETRLEDITIPIQNIQQVPASNSQRPISVDSSPELRVKKDVPLEVELDLDLGLELEPNNFYSSFSTEYPTASASSFTSDSAQTSGFSVSTEKQSERSSKSHLGYREKSRSRSARKDATKIQCPYCDNMYKNRQGLGSHIKITHFEKFSEYRKSRESVRFSEM